MDDITATTTITEMDEQYGWTAIRPPNQYTVAGQYQKRTFWQWLTRKPRRLRVFTVTNDITAD